jgi:hypothetical protein
MKQDIRGKGLESTSNNPATACTWLPESNCKEKRCNLHNQLACRWDPKEYIFAMGVVQSVPSLILTFTFTYIGIATGNWWSMLIFGWLIVMWPLGFEQFVLCRHCPFFTDCKKTLTCWALRFWPKWWKYSPRPLNRLEKLSVSHLLFSIPMFFWPVGWCAYGIYYMATNYDSFGLIALLGMIGLSFAVTLTHAQFFLILWSRLCTRCVNFSCPFNKVPKETVDAYLEMNPVMKAAWIDSGYALNK